MAKPTNKYVTCINRVKNSLDKYKYNCKKNKKKPNITYRMISNLVCHDFTFLKIGDGTNSHYYVYQDNPNFDAYGIYKPLSIICSIIDSPIREYSSRNNGYLLKDIKSYCDYSNIHKNVKRFKGLKEIYSHETNLVPVKNCIFNCKSKKIYHFSRKFIFFSKFPTEYHKLSYFSDNTKEVVDNLLNKSLNGKVTYQGKKFKMDGKYTFLQAIFSILNFTADRQHAFWLQGTTAGGNGKSTLASLCFSTLGANNLSATTLEQLQDSNFSESSLINKAGSIGDDENTTKEIGAKATTVLKKISTGTTTGLEKKGVDIKTYYLKVVVIETSNHAPKFYDPHALKRRVIIIPMFSVFKDSDLITDISAEKYCEYFLSLVLNKVKYFGSDYYMPPYVKHFTELAYNQGSHVNDFLSTTFIPAYLTVIPCMTLFKAFNSWSEAHGNKPVSYNTFDDRTTGYLGNRYVKKRARFSRNRINISEYLNSINIHINIPSGANPVQCYKMTNNYRQNRIDKINRIAKQRDQAEKHRKEAQKYLKATKSSKDMSQLISDMTYNNGIYEDSLNDDTGDLVRKDFDNVIDKIARELQKNHVNNIINIILQGYEFLVNNRNLKWIPIIQETDNYPSDKEAIKNKLKAILSKDNQESINRSNVMINNDKTSSNKATEFTPSDIPF